MNCFPCFQNKQESNAEEEKKTDLPIAQPKEFPPAVNPPGRNDSTRSDCRNAAETENNTVKSFTLRELATATKNFRQETLLGEGGFGKVFKGTIGATGQIVAVRQLDRNGTGGKDFVFEVSSLSLLQHPNLVRMVGYCADGEQRLLVYEYLPSGCLEKYLFDLPPGQSPLDWTTRMKIGLGIAEGLEYLHEKADPKIIYRDLKSSKVLLNEVKSPKLADYGLANIVQSGNRMHASVMAGYNGYCAPEYERNGELTIKSDVYSFGVVLLELITGRRALDTSRPVDDQSLVGWAQPIFKDPSKFPEMADPLLKKGFAITSLNQAVGVAAMCLQEEPSARPFISDISAALSFLAMAPPEAPIPERLVPILSRVSTSRKPSDHKQDNHSSDSSEDESDDEQGKQQQDYMSSSEYDYSDSYDGSDYEEEEEEETISVPSRDERNLDTSRCKSTKSKKLGSSSKRRSRKKSVKITSPRKSKTQKIVKFSPKAHASSSLKCHRSSTSFPEESAVPSTSGQDQNQQPPHRHSDYSSSSDEERWNNSISRNRSNATELRMNSRSDSYNSRSDDDDDDHHS
ncbi:hypothetical protein ACS0TY_009239 [Phlomoides rotata]